MRNENDAVGYLRQSQDDPDREKFSLPYQRVRVPNYCKDNSLNLLKVFEETRSAFKGKRIEFEKMLDFVEENDVPNIVTIRADRLSRNKKDSLRIDLLLDDGCLSKIHLADEGQIVTANDVDVRLVKDILDGVSEHHSKKKSKDMKALMAAKFDLHILPSVAPIGYLNVVDPTDPTGKRRTIIVDPERGYLVIKGFELYSTAEYTFETLWRKLVALGLTQGAKRGKLGRPLTVGTIDRMLKNKFYYGIMKWSGMKGPHKYPKLVSKELFDKCQKVMKRQDRNNGSKGKVFSFKSVLRCGYCGCSISGLPVAENGKVWTYYRCTSGKRSVDLDYYQKRFGSKARKSERKKGSPNYYCPQPIIPSPKLETFFAEKIAKFRFPTETLQYLVKALKEENLKKDEYREKEYGRLKAQYARIQNEKKIVYADRKKGLIDEEFLVEQWNELVEAEATIKEELEKLEVKNLDYEKEGVELLDRLYQLPLIYAQAKCKQRQEIILSLFQEVVVKEDRRKVRWVEPFGLLYEAGSTFKPAERDGL